MKVFINLDGEIVALCPEDDIEQEIKDSESTTAKIFEARRNIDMTLKENSRDHTHVLSPPVEDPGTRPRLTKFTLPKFQGDIMNGVPSGTCTSLPYMTIKVY